MWQNRYTILKGKQLKYSYKFMSTKLYLSKWMARNCGALHMESVLSASHLLTAAFISNDIYYIQEHYEGIVLR